MSADVGIKIEDYERVLTAMEYEVVFVVFRVARDAAEDTLARL